MAETFRIRHKQSGFITEPITAEQAKGIAGYPGDFDKIVPPKPLVVKEASAKKAAPRKPATGSKGKAKATKPTPAPTPAPAPTGGSEAQD